MGAVRVLASWLMSGHFGLLRTLWPIRPARPAVAVSQRLGAVVVAPESALQVDL